MRRRRHLCAFGFLVLAPSGLLAQSALVNNYEQAVVWTDHSNTLSTPGHLWKSGGSSWGWDGGAVSSQALTGDGYVEITAAASYVMFGLSHGNSSQDWTDIDFAMQTHDGLLYIYEGGYYRGSFGTFVAGDKLRVAVEGSVVTFRKNGSLLYTAEGAPLFPLLIDTTFLAPGPGIQGAVIYGGMLPTPVGVQHAVDWIQLANASVVAGNLQKTGGSSWGWDGGGVSSQTISGDGYVEVTAAASYMMFGLSHGNSSQDWSDIDFAMQTHDGSLYIYEGGYYRGVFGPFTPGDKLRVGVEGGVVTWRRNGMVLYVSVATPTYPLLVDSSLLQTGATIQGAVISSQQPQALSDAVPAAPMSYSLEPGVSVSAAAGDGVIRVLAFYTPAVAARLGVIEVVSRVSRDVLSMQQALTNSGSSLTVQLLDVRPLNYVEPMESDPDRPGELRRSDLIPELWHLSLQAGSPQRDDDEGKIDEIHQQRTDAQADVVALFVDGGRNCGIAQITSWNDTSATALAVKEDQGFYVGNILCSPGGTLAHEMGHVLGLYHGNYETEVLHNGPGIKWSTPWSPFAFGYAQPDGLFHTLMTPAVCRPAWHCQCDPSCPDFRAPAPAGCRPPGDTQCQRDNSAPIPYYSTSSNAVSFTHPFVGAAFPVGNGANADSVRVFNESSGLRVTGFRGGGLVAGPVVGLAAFWALVDAGRTQVRYNAPGAGVSAAHLAWMELDESGKEVLYSRFVVPCPSGPCFTETPGKARRVHLRLLSAGGFGPWAMLIRNPGSGFLENTCAEAGGECLAAGAVCASGSVVATDCSICCVANGGATCATLGTATQSFSVEPSVRYTGQPLTLTAGLSAITPGSAPLWDVGTGDHLAGSPTTYTYILPGTYTVTLTSNDANCQTTVLTTQAISVVSMPPQTCSDVANQINHDFVGCGGWEQDCTNHPGASAGGSGSDCLGTVCCFFPRSQPPPPDTQSCGQLGGEVCSQTTSCPSGFSSLGATRQNGAVECQTCCNLTNGDGYCEPGVEDCGTSPDCPCWMAGTTCNASGSPGQCVDRCSDPALHNHSGSCGLPDECGHAIGTAQECLPSCGALGGDYCSQTSNSCPAGHGYLAQSNDCQSCCQLDPCANPETHDHGGSCGSVDSCGHGFGSNEDCGCPGAPIVFDTCWGNVCDTGWSWVPQLCETCEQQCTTQWSCSTVCDEFGCWDECVPFDDCSQVCSTYECGGYWTPIETNCRTESYQCNPHQCTP